MMKNWICVFLAAVLVASCLPRPEEALSPGWTYADLRLIDSPGEAAPALDLIAVYTRLLQSEFQVRLDLLELTPQVDGDIYLALDTRPGGSTRLPGGAETGLAWDVLVVLPASGPALLQTFHGSSVSSTRLRILRDPTLDAITLSFEIQSILPHSRFSMGRKIGLQVFTTAPGTSAAADRTEPIRSGGLPPARLPVLAAFWNTLPAATPAQALRRWNGAHTGPHNTRHGLRSLIQAVDRSGFPIVLLDLKSPETLSTLDYLGALPDIRRLAEAGLLILPEVAPVAAGVPGQAFSPTGWVFERAVAQSRQYSTAFSLPTSSFLYLPGLSDPAELLGDAQNGSQAIPTQISSRFRFLFTHSRQAPPPGSGLAGLSPWRWQSLRGLTLPGSGGAPQQVNDEGLAIELRQALAAAAAGLDPAGGQVFFLGGDLSQSAWGEPQAARNSLQYLAGHPWIRPVSAYDLLAARQGQPSSAGMPASTALPEPQPFLLGDAQGDPIASRLTTAQVHERLLVAFRDAPPGLLTETAWRAYLALLSPASPESAGLQRMRANYLGQIGHLLAAARWEVDGLEAVCDPPAGSPCLADLDWDGQDEVILANARLFAVLETEGGIMTYGLARGPGGVHQVIGPSSQFTVGLSDPTAWKIDRGRASDPGQVPGALADLRPGYLEPAWGEYEAILSENRVLFTAPDRSLAKTIQLMPNGWRFDYNTAAPVRVQIPFTLDPWVRFTPGWGEGYLEKAGDTGWNWGFNLGPQVRLETSGALLTQAFHSTRQAIREPEDPNYAYPPGHFLPFPMALAEIRGEGEFQITITIDP